MNPFFTIFAFILALSMSCSRQPQIHTFEGKIMGTYYSVKVVAGPEFEREKLDREIEDYLKYLNAIFSTYDPNSELSKLNQAKAKELVEISDEMEEVLLTSKKVHKNTEGYFDVTVGPVVNAWGFGPEGRLKEPNLEELENLKAKVGMDLFEVEENNKFHKREKDIYIDLSAIAKGYAVDRMLMFLKEKGYESILVEIGGETRTLGKKPGGSSWLIGIEKPAEKLGGGIQVVVELNNQAVATSGSYRNFVKYGEEVFSHTIDPTTGKPAKNKLISVSVLAPTCALADAYATAMLAMGPEKALLLAKKVRLPAYFLVKKDEKIDTIMTDSFKQYIKEI